MRTIATLTSRGGSMARCAICLALARGDIAKAATFAANRYPGTGVAGVMKAAIAAGGLTPSDNWAAPLGELLHAMSVEFMEMARPLTVFGRMLGVRVVPLLTKVVMQDARSGAAWVGEATPKPVSKLGFADNGSLARTKVASITVQTDELVRCASVQAEQLIRDDMASACALAIDQAAFDPSNAGIPDVKPASITAGALTVPATDNIGDDLAAAEAALPSGLWRAVWVMNPKRAAALSNVRGSTGSYAYPAISPRGGTLMGLAAFTSDGVPVDIIALMDPATIVYGDEDVLLKYSRAATIQMDSAPDIPSTAASLMQSLWQNNLHGFLTEQTLCWKCTGGVVVITGLQPLPAGVTTT